MTLLSRLGRPTLSSVTLTVVVAAYLLLATNFTFWSKGVSYFQGHGLALASLAAGLFALHVASITAVSVKYVLKPLLILLILISALAAYFTDTFGVVIDKDMIRNAAVTTSNEARHLITPKFLTHLVLFGAFPAALVAWTRVEHHTFGQKLVQHSKIIFACLALAGAVTFANYLAYATVFRQHRDFMATLNPISPIVGAVKYGRSMIEEQNIVVQPIGTDAKRGQIAKAETKPMVTIIVAGETARAQNFSLFGYGRETNPELKKRDVVAFSNTASCGTATAVSLPCMFSQFPRADYSNYKGKAYENLLDVMKHAGVRALWWDNNTGHKGLADRIESANFASGNDTRFCYMGECRDDILVDRLKTELANVTQDTVIVLHQIGSHGPAYFMRYQEETAPFKPDCRTGEFVNCKPEEIINAYDNTIHYTDKILSEIIDLLAAQDDRFSSAMIYMSDHGESLGEKGLYLHAAPYMFAPAEQTHVPFIAWFSKAYQAATGLDVACLKAASGEPYSHDNLFHTALGMMDVQTGVYDQSLDAFAACRTGHQTALVQSVKTR